MAKDSTMLNSYIISMNRKYGRGSHRVEWTDGKEAARIAEEAIKKAKAPKGDESAKMKY